ncbi:hypothetical protein PHYBOEH_009413 [Phytophthora boehmeriae]|uniref:RxLR effector protein n=1 Tax=Phytophthora boehmeriae TaxID=109152 RepID=A0A8T1VXI6_9STRA|nr:hypothetical protein PHYBOEH_009413 [Phytophthora boehmeriae]
MRFSYFVLVAAASLLASADGISPGVELTKMGSPQKLTEIRSLTVGNKHDTTTRLLRTAKEEDDKDDDNEDDDDDDDDDESAINEERKNVNVVALVKPVVKASSKAKFAMWKYLFRWNTFKVQQHLEVFDGPGLPRFHKNWPQVIAYKKFYGKPLTYP